jgi:glucan phosphoethanolaminetransferase (alkaline phosphatase superfamily)
LLSKAIENHGRVKIMKNSSYLLGFILIFMRFCESYIEFTILITVLSFLSSGYLISIFTYIPEITSENLRLIYPNMYGLGILLGKILIFSVGVYYREWKMIMTVIGGVSAVNGYIISQYFVESPRYLIIKKQFS